MSFQLKNISKQYNGITLLNDVTLDIECGTICGLLGYNGAGKSVLSRVISGIVKEDQGEIYLDGKQMKDWSVELAISNGIFLMNHEILLFSNMRIIDNIIYGLNRNDNKKSFVFLKRKQEIEKKLDLEIKKYKLPCNKYTKVSKLSYSLKRILELIRIKIFSPKYLIIDEVDTNLNEEYKKIMIQILCELRENGVGILYISHQIEDVLMMVDKIVILHGNQIYRQYEKEELSLLTLNDKVFIRSLENPPRVNVKAKTILLEVLHIDTKSINDFNMVVREGEIVGIIGLEKEGAGSIDGIFFSYSCSKSIEESGFFLYGAKIEIKKPEDMIKNSILMIDTNEIGKLLFEKKSVMENLLPYSIQIKYRDEKKREEICKNILGKMSIDTNPREKIENLSTGYQKKILIARSILSDGEVYIFNHPTDHIDVISKVDIYNIINELKRQGKGIVFVSNDWQEIKGICDTIIEVKYGKIVKEYKNKSFGI